MFVKVRDSVSIANGSPLAVPASRVSQLANARAAQLLALIVASGIFFWGALRNLTALVLNNGSYNYIALVPVISLCVLFLERRRIFVQGTHSPVLGVSLLVPGILTFLTAELLRPASVTLTLEIFAIVLIWNALFLLCYGPRAFRKGIFGLLFLFSMVPPPAAALDKMMVFLQAGSAGVSYFLFKLCGIPVLKDGFLLLLPGLQVEVAKQCSGIRSSACLLLIAIVSGHLFLRSNSRKVLLACCVLPIVILKNAVRIFTITTFGLYVDSSYYHGSLHREYGGMLFSVLGIALLLPLIRVLQKSEHAARR